MTPNDERHVRAAQGYLELGLFLDADAELEEVAAEFRHQRDVLAVRVGIYQALKKWELMQTVAARLANIEPENVGWAVSLAFATRRAESIQAAKLLLLSAVERHPNEPLLHYNLACYECQLGEIEVAKARLAQAFSLHAGYRLIALDDEDLAPLWDSIGE